jgi:NADH-quinone oxidoreductase subunit E
MKEIADALGVRPAEVLDTASFYEEYWLKPKGKHLVSVCRSIACECLGQREVTEALKAKLGVDVGETTDDDRFTLIELECLGACGGAPAILIDETLHEHVSPQAVGKLIEGVKDGPGGHGGHGGH